MNMHRLTEILHREKCSLAICHSDHDVTLYWQRGVKDLLDLIHTRPTLLSGAMIADKVVGKGAAALMIIGNVRQVYADVISRPALYLLQSAAIEVSYGECVANIINRAGTGICPVESLCSPCATAEECLPLIEEFVSRMTQPPISK